MRFTVRKKLIAVFTCMFLMIGWLSWTDMSRMAVLKDNSKEIVRAWLMGVETIEDTHYRSEHLLTVYYKKQLEPDVKKQAPMDEELTQTVSEIDNLLEKYKGTLAGDQDAKNYGELEKNWEAFKVYFEKSQKLGADPGKAKEAQENMVQLSGAFVKVQQILGVMVKFNQEGADLAEHSSAELYKKSVTQSIIVLSIILVFMLIVSILLVRIISRPVRQASDALNRIAEGDLTVEPIHVKNKDEIGTLIQSVNQMVVHLRYSVDHMLQASNSVAASSQQLFASSEQTASASTHVAEAVQEFAAGADKQAMSSLECGRAMEEMSAGVQRIAETTSDVSELSNSATMLAKQGTEAMKRVVAKMQTVSHSVGAAHEVIQELEKHSENIGQISTLIGSIASQTNLLALNAAIEAARAGESGKGFAVVAGEVRKLASQTDESVRGISELIMSIQRGSVRAVQAMHNGLSEVHDGMKEVAIAEQAFGQIVSASEEVASKVQETAAAAEEMAASSQEVAATVANVGHVAQQISGTAQSVAADTEEQLASTEEITASAKSLADIAQDLQKIVNTFRI